MKKHLLVTYNKQSIPKKDIVHLYYKTIIHIITDFGVKLQYARYTKKYYFI